MVIDRHGYAETAYFTFSYSPLWDHGGEPAGMLATLTETTRKVLTERRQRFLLGLEDALRPLHDPSEVMRVATERLAEHLQANRCAYAAMEPDEEHFTLTSGISRDGLPITGRFRLSAFSAATAAAMRRGEVFVANDIGRESRLSREEIANCRARNIASGVWAPLHKDGRFVAGLAVNHHAPRVWTEHEIEIVRLVVDRCWEAIERVHADLALERHRQELVEADRRKNEFLAMLGHELRNPLAPITNALRLLERGEPLSDQGRRLLAIAERQRAQLCRLVDDLLEVSRITLGKIELRVERIAVDAAVRAVVEARLPGIEDRGQTLEMALPADPVHVLADPARFAQVLDNLLNNAKKFTPDGGRIRIEVEAQGEWIELRVRDDGVGIAPDKLPRLFALFSQIDATLDRSQGGLGIGLALVKRLVELHGGTVAAASDGLGAGATFTVRLPREAPRTP